MSVAKSQLFIPQAKTYQRETEGSIAKDYSFESQDPDYSNFGPDYRKQYQDYRGLELRSGGNPNPEALEDLDGMEGDLENYGVDEGSEELDLGPTPATAKEIREFSKKMSALKNQISAAKLPEDKNFIKNADQLLKDLKGHKIDLDEALSQLEQLGEDFKQAKTDQQQKKDDLEEFKDELSEAKREFKKTVNSNSKLTPQDKENLINEFNQYADDLPNDSGLSNNTKDLETVRGEFEKFQKKMNNKIEEMVDAIQDKAKQEKDSLRDQVLKIGDDENVGTVDDGGKKVIRGHHWQVGLEACQKFKTALQTDHWDDFRTFISGLNDGDQRFVPIMRLVTALVRTAGGDETKALDMLNHLVPKEVVQVMIDKLNSVPEAREWGGGIGHEGQIGPNGNQCKWNPGDTAKFLNKSLDARRDVDPYTADKETSSSK